MQIFNWWKNQYICDSTISSDFNKALQIISTRQTERTRPHLKMASRLGGRVIARRAAVDEEKKKKQAVREDATLLLPTKGKGKKGKTRSTSTEQPDPQNTGRPLTRRQKATVDEGKLSSRVTARQRASIARHESRFLTVAAVNVARKRTEKEGHKSTTSWREKTACTHPTTAATSKASAAPGKKTRQRHSIRSHSNEAQTRKSHAPSTETDSTEVGKSGPTFKQTATSMAETGKSGLTIPRPDVITVRSVRDPDIDIADPQLGRKYILYLLRELERRPVFAIKENLLANQKQVTETHRRKLIDWVVQVHRHFMLSPVTLYLTVNIMDRVLQVHTYLYACTHTCICTCTHSCTYIHIHITATFSLLWCLKFS